MTEGFWEKAQGNMLSFRSCRISEVEGEEERSGEESRKDKQITRKVTRDKLKQSHKCHLWELRIPAFSLQEAVPRTRVVIRQSLSSVAQYFHFF